MGKVGPVLRNNRETEGIIEALKRDTDGEVEVTDRRAYLRVEAEDRCVVTKETLDEILGKGAIQVPGGIEEQISSFKGYIKPQSDRIEFVSDIKETHSDQ
ncbi:MmoB/DmpM family protein [Halobellus inordinatus]|uniref:MmoB/DmpM family protein n=1 Tax=Halobellus inordinatus TaxID=1126236 RepID=UPI00210A8FAC|nr:MmoB/DmpM family protein [Halobellus inordinatus]